GGTMLNANSQEVAWFDTGNGAGTEGGFSAQESHPSFQDDTYSPARARSTPDISFIASSVSIVDELDTLGTGGSGFWLSGIEGTSLSAPCWASVLAIPA